MCSKDITLVSECGETLFFYPVANTFSQTGCQIPIDIIFHSSNHFQVHVKHLTDLLLL